jgi:hypothetical protein
MCLWHEIWTQGEPDTFSTCKWRWLMWHIGQHICEPGYPPTDQR